MQIQHSILLNYHDYNLNRLYPWLCIRRCNGLRRRYLLLALVRNNVYRPIVIFDHIRIFNFYHKVDEAS